MVVFLAGATGVLGRRLGPMLVAAGHRVIGMTHTPTKFPALRAMGVEPVVADALDAQGVANRIMAARPDVVVHELTALSRMRSLKNFDNEFALTNRLRTEGTRYLLTAARAAGTKRFVAQSFTGWTNPREGGPVKNEADPLDPTPPAEMSRTLGAIQELEELVSEASDVLTGIVLRYGILYGPGTSLGEGGDLLRRVRDRRLPVVGDGSGIWSFLHIEDAARATLLAVAGGPAGTYNIVDDEPAKVAAWVPELARSIGAPPPHHLPAWLGRLLMGEAGVSMMTSVRGSSNARAKRVLGWQPYYPTWREGFRRGLAA